MNGGLFLLTAHFLNKKTIKMKQEIIKAIQDTLVIIGGGKGLPYYMAGFFFSFLTIWLSIYLHSQKRDINSPNTPYNFSYTFFIWDNLKRAIASLTVMFLIFRLFDCSNVMVMVSVGFFVSFGVDKVIEWMMNNFNFLNFLKTNRDKFPRLPGEEKENN